MNKTRKQRCAICKGPAEVCVFDKRFDGELHPWLSCLADMDQSNKSDEYFKVSFLVYNTLDIDEAMRLAWSGSAQKRIDPKQPSKTVGPAVEISEDKNLVKACAWFSEAQLTALEEDGFEYSVEMIRVLLEAVQHNLAELSRVRSALGLDAEAPLEQEAALIRKERDDLRAQVAEMAKDRAMARLARLRAQGWVVAVHNDYRLGGELFTFWLFSKGNRCAKGEGRTDDDALVCVEGCVAALAEPLIPPEPAP